MVRWKLGNRKWGVAGGINSWNVEDVFVSDEIERVIVGAAIVAASDPELEAHRLRLKIDQMSLTRL
jgi:3-keto-L-gulonate-6-phosphate decarboxylase